MSLLRILSLAVIAVFAMVGIVAPLTAVLAGLRFSAFLDPVVLAVVRASLSQALVSTLISAAAGAWLGLWLGSAAQSSDAGARRWARIALRLWALPYTVPTVVAAMAWVDWLGTHGIAARLGFASDWLYSMRAVILAHVFLNIPWVALWVARARAAVPPRELDAADSLGATEARRFRVCVWPRVRWAFFSSVIQVFGLCNMSFAIVLLLGGGPPVETLETAIYSKLRFSGIDLKSAAGLAGWELLLTLLPWALLVLREARSALARAPLSPSGTRAVPGGRMKAVVAAVAAAAFLLPYVVLLDPQVLTASRAEGFGADLLRSIGISFALAAATTAAALTATFAGLLLARKTFFQILLSMPAGISTLVLGLGVWLAYSQWLDPFSGFGTFGAIVLVQATIFVPLAFRNLLPSLLTVRGRDLEAAASLGASPIRAFWLLEWPRWRAPVLCAGAVVAGAALSELAAVSLFYNERLVPLPLLVSRWMSHYRFAEAQAVSALLLLLALAIVAVVTAFGDSIERVHR